MPLLLVIMGVHMKIQAICALAVIFPVKWEKNLSKHSQYYDRMCGIPKVNVGEITWPSDHSDRSYLLPDAFWRQQHHVLNRKEMSKTERKILSNWLFLSHSLDLAVWGLHFSLHVQDWDSDSSHLDVVNDLSWGLQQFRWIPMVFAVPMFFHT